MTGGWGCGVFGNSLLTMFLIQLVVLIAHLLLVEIQSGLLGFVQVAAAAMVDIEVVFHAYSAADRARIDKAVWY